MARALPRWILACLAAVVVTSTQRDKLPGKVALESYGICRSWCSESLVEDNKHSKKEIQVTTLMTCIDGCCASSITGPSPCTNNNVLSPSCVAKCGRANMFYHGLDFEGRDFKTGSIEIKHVNKKPVLFIKPFKMKPVEVTPKLMSPHQIEGAAKEFVSSLQNLKLKLHGGAEENPPNMNSGDIIAKLLPTHPMSIGKMSPKLESIGTLKADTEPNEPFKFKILEEKAPTLAKGDVLKAVLAEGKTVGLLMDMKLKPLPPKLGVDDIIAAAQEIQTQISEVDDHIKMHVAEHDPDPTQLEQIKPAPLNINYAMQLAALTLADESDTPIEHPFKIAPEAIDAKTIGVTKESFQKLDKQTVATIVPLLLAPQGAESSKYAPTNVEWYYRYTSHREDVYGPFFSSEDERMVL